MDLRLLAPDLFGLEYEQDDALRAARRWRYAHHYWLSA